VSNKPIFKKISDVKNVLPPNSEKATLQVLLGKDDNMPNFYTRIFTIEPGGYIPRHLHDAIEHQQVMIEGTMELSIGNETKTVTMGNVMYLPANIPHGYANKTDKTVRFMCVIPANIEYSTEFVD